MNKNDGDFAAWAIGDKLGRDVNETWDYLRNQRKEEEQKRQAAAREAELKFAAEMREIEAEIAQDESDRRVRELAAQLRQRNEDIEAIKRDLKGQLSYWMIAQFAQAKARKKYQEQLGIPTEQYREEYKKIKQEVLAEHPDIANRFEEYKKLQSHEILKKYRNDTYTKEKSLDLAKRYELLDVLESQIDEIERDKKAQVILDNYFANKMNEQLALEMARDRGVYENVKAKIEHAKQVAYEKEQETIKAKQELERLKQEEADRKESAQRQKDTTAAATLIVGMIILGFIIWMVNNA